MMNYGFLLIAALLFAIVGFVLGALVVLLISRRDKKKGQEPQRAPKQKERYQEIVRLVRDTGSGKIYTEVDGHILPPAQTLPEEQHKKLTQLAREWVDWLGLRTPAAPAPVPTPPPAARLTPPPVDTGPLTRVAPPAAEMALPTVPAVEPIPAVLFPPAPNLETARPAPVSIVAQINDILQDMIADTPLRERMVRLSEEPREGVIVWVGTQRYIGIDAVPDSEVKAAIRAAVAKWERQPEKG